MTGMLLETTAARAIEALPSLALAILAPTDDDARAEHRAYAHTLGELARETDIAVALHVHHSICDLLLIPADRREAVAAMVAAHAKDRSLYVAL